MVDWELFGLAWRKAFLWVWRQVMDPRSGTYRIVRNLLAPHPKKQISYLDLNPQTSQQSDLDPKWTFKQFITLISKSPLLINQLSLKQQNPPHHHENAHPGVENWLS